MDFEDSHAAKTAGVVRNESGADPYQAVLDRIRKQLSKEFTADKLANAGPQLTEAAARVAAQQYRDYNQDALTKTLPRLMIPEEQFIDMALADLLGMGAIDTLLKDETIEDIAINGPNEVMVYRHGHWEKENVSFFYLWLSFKQNTTLLALGN